MATRRVAVSRLNGERRHLDLYVHSFVERFAVQARREASMERARLAMIGERAAIEEDAATVVAPFGLDWHDLDPLVLDTLAWVTPDGDHWRWHGRTSNKGVAVVRLRRAAAGVANTEWTAARILHRLVVVDHELPANMRQRCGAEFMCVRPEHRCRWCP